MRANLGVEVSPGFKTNLMIERVFEEILPQPYSECQAPDDHGTSTVFSDIYSRIQRSNYAYTQQLCLTACFHQALIEQCNCVKPNELTFFPEVRVCNLHDPCLIAFNRRVFDYANCSCPLQCNRTQYLFSMSMVPLNVNFVEYIKKNFAADFVTKPIDIERVKMSVARIYLFYDSLSYVKSIEMATSGSVLELISNIGGTLGLFLGVSVLSLFEAFEVMLEVCFVWLKRRRRTTRRVQPFRVNSVFNNVKCVIRKKIKSVEKQNAAQG